MYGNVFGEVLKIGCREEEAGALQKRRPLCSSRELKLKQSQGFEVQTATTSTRQNLTTGSV